MEDEAAGKLPSKPGAWGFGAALGLMAGTFAYIPLANLLLGTFGLSSPNPDEPVTSLSILHWVAWGLALFVVLVPGFAMLAAPRARKAGVGYLGMTLVVGCIAAYAMISGITANNG